MCLKFRPRLLYLSSKALFLQEQQRNVSAIQTTIADFTITNQKRQFGGIITRYGSEIQTTIAILTIANRKGPFWRKNKKKCV